MPEFDDWIDAQLRNVPLPADLLWRLAETGRTRDDAAGDARLDTLVANVPVPLDLEVRLRRIAIVHHRPEPHWLRFGLAASVFLMTATGSYFALWGLAPSRSVTETAQRAPTVSKKVGPPTAVTQTIARSAAIARARITPTRAATAAELPAQPSDATPADDFDGVGQTASVEDLKLPFNFEQVADWSRTVKSAIDERLKASRSTLGSGGKFEHLPVLESFESPSPRGVMPPRVRGYDLLFYLKQGEHPFTSPSAHRSLSVSKMPFTFRTASYDLAQGSAREGIAPASEEIRVEDFLAAQEYSLPTPPINGVALHTAIVASPFRDKGLHLLQLVVKAGPKRAAPHRPTRLIVVLDASARMAAAGRWETAVRGLARFADDLSPADRVTLIGFAGQSRVLAADATPHALRELIASATRLQLAGPADFAAATAAAAQAIASRDTDEQKVVFITAGREVHGETTLEKSRENLARLATQHVSWRLLRLSSEDAQDSLQDTANATHGIVTAAASWSDVRTALWEELHGQSSIVANGVSLRLVFNPKVVTAYRLMGHASSNITGAAGDPLEIDLHVDETATAMYELSIKPTGVEKIAGVELEWLDPTGGRQRGVAQWVRQAQISESFAQASPWFQQGIIAAKTAEALRASYFAPGPRALEQVHELARQVDSRAAERPDFQGLLHLLELVQKLR